MTLVAIEGWCVGGGMALVAGLDLRVASTSAQLCIPEIDRGMNMRWQSIPRWVSLIAAPRTRRLTLLAERVDAQRALDWQLVDELVPQGEALAAARAMAERVAALPPVQLRMGKEGINLAAGALHQALNTMDRDPFMLAQASDDCQEGVRSFLEKRPRCFEGVEAAATVSAGRSAIFSNSRVDWPQRPPHSASPRSTESPCWTRIGPSAS